MAIAAEVYGRASVAARCGMAVRGVVLSPRDSSTRGRGDATGRAPVEVVAGGRGVQWLGASEARRSTPQPREDSSFEEGLRGRRGRDSGKCLEPSVDSTDYVGESSPPIEQ
jgi:hypothetical protein